MNNDFCRSLLAVPMLVVILVLSGCVESSSKSTNHQPAQTAQSTGPNSELLTNVASLDSVNIVIDADSEKERQLQNVIRAIPDRDKRYSILFVKLDASMDYKILKMNTDPKKKFSIIVVDPETNERDHNLTDYFIKALPIPNEEP
jgi:hypothetical protein